MILIVRPRPILQGPYRVIRGGCWSSNGRYCRSAVCFWNVPMDRFIDLGFRVALKKKAPG